MDNWFETKEMKRLWTFAPDRPHPVIYLRELRLLERLEDREPIQRIEFHPGLNIVWADPKVQQARQGGPRLAGHSAGKTTFCRIIRWLLGETHFGPDEAESGVALAFKEGWALLHLELDGNPWVVGRAFWNRADHHAVRNTTIANVQKDGWPEANEKDEFLAELVRLTLSPLIRQRFPGEKKDINFTELLGWLARDQEAALHCVDSWRSTASGNHQPSPDKANRHILMRLVLQLIEVTEWEELMACAALEAERESWKNKEPALKASARASCEPLARIFGEKLDGLDGALLISKAERLVQGKEDQRVNLREQFNGIGIKETEKALEAAIANRAKGEKAIETSERNVKRLEKRVSERDAALIKAKAKTLSKSRLPLGVCIKTRDECEFFEGIPEGIGAAQTADDIQNQRDYLQETLDEERQDLTSLQEQIQFLRACEETSRDQRDQAAKERDSIQAKLAAMEAALNADREVLYPAKDCQKSLDECQKEIAVLTESIRESREQQRAIRQARWLNRNVFGDQYRALLQQLTAKGRGAHLQFDKDGLFDPGTSGSAVNALEVLAFDLAAMLWSASGKGLHPRFLIHDSPRVADMSPVPYSAIFDLIAAAEKDCEGALNFQYIITTTEAPPEDIREGRLILTLDASDPKGLLFKREY